MVFLVNDDDHLKGLKIKANFKSSIEYYMLCFISLNDSMYATLLLLPI